MYNIYATYNCTTIYVIYIWSNERNHHIAIYTLLQSTLRVPDDIQ